MARAVSWTLSALDDLEQIAEYIARDSVAYAAAFISEALAAGQSLEDFSDRGRIVPELDDPSIRELFVGSYRVIYGVDDTVDVLAIVHGARDLAALWDRDPAGSDTPQ